MISDFVRGFGYLFRGLALVRRPGLRRFVVVPLLVNVLLFGVGVGYLVHEFSLWMERLTGWLPDWLDWLTWMLWPLFALTVLVVVFYTFSILANLIAAPFNSVLAARAESLLRGEAPRGSDASLLSEALRTIGSELRKLGYLLLWAIPLLILFIIPGVNLLAPLAWGLFGMWMLALEYADYPMGNHGLFFPQVRARVRQRRWLALGLGAGILLLSMIPLLNFLAMPVGVCAATALWVDHFSSLEAPEA